MNISALSNTYLNAFNPNVYTSQNRDVKAALDAGVFQSAYEHFVNFGHTENRSFSAFFDGEFYLQNNPDVARVAATGATSAYAHFLQFGQAEGRAAFQGFNDADYLQANSDVASAVSAGIFKSGWDHYVRFGVNEGRPGFTTRNIEFGTDEANTLTAQEGELVFGLGGNDTITAGVNSNFDTVTNPNVSKLYGNEGADTFVFSSNSLIQITPTVIGDFQLSQGDRILVNIAGFDNFETVQNSSFVDAAGNSVILGTRVIIEAVSELDASMFDFI